MSKEAGLDKLAGLLERYAGGGQKSQKEQQLTRQENQARPEDRPYGPFSHTELRSLLDRFMDKITKLDGSTKGQLNTKDLLDRAIESTIPKTARQNPMAESATETPREPQSRTPQSGNKPTLYAPRVSLEPGQIASPQPKSPGVLDKIWGGETDPKAALRPEQRAVIEAQEAAAASGQFGVRKSRPGLLQKPGGDAGWNALTVPQKEDE